MITTLSRRSAVVLLCIVFNVFCFSRVVGDETGASATAFAAGSEVQQIVLTCATFFFVSAVLIYVISVFGMRERTFEEALEQQRLQPGGASLLSLQGKKSSSAKAGGAKPDKKKKEKEVKRKTSSSKPAKSSTAAASAPPVPETSLAEVESSVEATPPPLPLEEGTVVAVAAVVEEVTVVTAAPISKSAKKKKNKKSQDSLVEESAPAEAVVDVPEAAVVADEVPVEEVGTEVVESVTEPLVNGLVEATAPSEVAPSEEPDVIDVHDLPADSQAEEAKEKRKKKKKSPSLSEEAAAVAPLTDAEMVVQLKSILEEKARVLKETKISLGNSQTRLGENRGWLKAERAKVAELETTLAETVQAKTVEVQSLNQQLQQKLRDFQGERAALQSKHNALQEKMQEAGAEAHGRLQHLQAEAKSWREAADRARKDYEARIQQLEEEKQRVKKATMEDAQAALHRQMQELNEKLQQSEARCAAVAKEVSEAQRVNDRANELENAVGLRETRISQLNSQLTEAENSRNAMDTQLKMMETRLQEVSAQCKEAQAKLLIAEENLMERSGAPGDESATAAPSTAEESTPEVADLQSLVAAKDAEISRMQGELASIKSEVLNMVNQEKNRAEEARALADKTAQDHNAHLAEEKAVRKELEEKLEQLRGDLARATSRIEQEEANKKELEGKLADAAGTMTDVQAQLATKVDPESEQLRIVEALREIQTTTASNIAKEESTASVASLVAALKSSFALHLLPSSISTNAEEFFAANLTTAIQKVVDHQVQAKDDEYATQVQALKDALNVQIEDADDKIKEDSQGEEIQKLQAELEKSTTAAAHFEKELSERRAELEAKAAIVGGLESTIAETKKQLFQLRTSLTQEADAAAQLRELVASKEEEIVDANRRLEASKAELAATVEKAIDAAVAKSTQVFDEEKKKLEEEAKAKEKNYNAILKETEGMLSKLQMSVEAEEKKWTAKLQSKEEELRQLKTSQEEEKLSKEVTDAFREELEAKLAALEGEKGEWELEKREIHSRLAAAEERLDREKETAQSAAAAVAASQGSLESELKREKEEKAELRQRLETAESVAAASKGQAAALATEVTTTKAALEKASKEVDEAGSRQRASEAEVAALRRETETLKSQLAATMTTPSKKDKKDKKKGDEKNGDVGEGENGAAHGDNVSVGGVSIGAASIGGSEEKKKKGKSLAKLFSPKSK